MLYFFFYQVVFMVDVMMVFIDGFVIEFLVYKDLNGKVLVILIVEIFKEFVNGMILRVISGFFDFVIIFI